MKSIIQCAMVLLAMVLLTQIVPAGQAQEYTGGILYTQIVSSKDTLAPPPEIRCDVMTLDNNSGSFDVGAMHTWIICADVPSGIGSAKEYTIFDLLNYRLSYEEGSLTARLYTKSGSFLELQRDVHYVLTEGTDQEDGRIIPSVSISLTEDGMSYIASNQEEGDSCLEIRVIFRASINRNAAMGSTVPNDAHLYYVNADGDEYQTDSDIPEVHTGGLHFLNMNGEGTALPGAVFMIAREATQREMEMEAVPKEVLYVNGKDVAVVYPSFYVSRDLSGKKTDKVTTAENGTAGIYGLAYGTYYLVEIQPPEGYDQLAEPVMVYINESSHLQAEDGWQDEQGKLVDKTLHITRNKFVLPDTGGIGRGAILVPGLLAMLFSGIGLIKRRNQL